MVVGAGGCALPRLEVRRARNLCARDSVVGEGHCTRTRLLVFELQKVFILKYFYTLLLNSQNALESSSYNKNRDKGLRVTICWKWWKGPLLSLPRHPPQTFLIAFSPGG